MTAARQRPTAAGHSSSRRPDAQVPRRELHPHGVAIELGIGTLILDSKDPRGGPPRSFGISVGRIFGVGKAAPRDGVYSSVTLAYVHNGKRFAASTAAATLQGGRTRGSFTGRLFTGEAISGTFRCS